MVATLPATTTNSPNYSQDEEDRNHEFKDCKEQERNQQSRRDLLTKYNALLDSRPLLTKSITASVVSGLGALLASIMSGKKNQRFGGGVPRTIDWNNVFAFALHGGLVNGPVGHFWFEWMSKNGPKSAFKSMLLDQLAVQPPLLVFMFVFLDMSKAAMREMRPSLGRTLSAVGPTIINSWRFWPLVVLAT